MRRLPNFFLPFHMLWNMISHNLSHRTLNILAHSLLNTVPRSLLNIVVRSSLSTFPRSWWCSWSRTQFCILVFRSRLLELPALLQLGRPKPQAERGGETFNGILWHRNSEWIHLSQSSHERYHCSWAVSRICLFCPNTSLLHIGNKKTQQKPKLFCQSLTLTPHSEGVMLSGRWPWGVWML